MTTHEHDHTHAHHSDRKAAFLGLIIGAVVIFGILRTIIAITNAHYAHEKPAATATK
jgi:uncharacterized protein (DUF983 family)